MRKNRRLWMWRICIWVQAAVVIWMIGRLFCAWGEPQEAAGEHFVVSKLDISVQEDEEAPEAQKTGKADYVLSNFDTIRVVLTSPESGSIYHEDVAVYERMIAEGTDAQADYRGILEIWDTKEGYVVINELPIEEYLYSVVPSEMPASYPLEALKAQAICARTYAYLHILSPGYPEWNAHVDDTTAFQVYHSVEEQARTNQAVNETQGLVLLAPGGLSLAQTYYYSTSCGYGSDAHVWRTKYSDCYPYIMSRHINRETVQAMSTAVVTPDGYKDEESRQDEMLEEAFTMYIKNVNSTDYEADESWYRWSYEVEEVDLERMLKTLQKRYEANKNLVLTLQGDSYVSQPVEELDSLVDLVIEKREAGGVADELLIITEKNIYKVITELNIRYVLNDGVTKALRQDGSEVAMPSLIPSAFIVLENQYDNGEVRGYHIIGGGFGHGAGMSQNAAKAMAEEGMKAEEILEFFFVNCKPVQKE